MGWGEARPPSVETAADRLADAVRRWRDNPTTGNGARLAAVLDTYDQAREAERRTRNGGPGPIHVQLQPEPPRVVYVPVPSDGTGRRCGW